MKSLLVALQFLTPIPIKLSSVDTKDLARSMRYFPLVGLFIGLILVLVKILAFGPLNFSAMVTATLVLLALTALSGGLHLDGLGDMCDGFYAGRSKEDIVKVMRDPHIGAMGVIGIFFILMIKWSLLMSLPWGVADYSAAVLIMTPLMGRWSMVVAAGIGPYAQAAAQGTAKPFVDNIRFKDVIISTAIAFIATLALSVISRNMIWVLLMAVALIAVQVMVMAARRMIGGITGDILGAINEVTETFVLFGAYMIYLWR
jgi:adenosylcobinamide-GDP ribazoletransferase